MTDRSGEKGARDLLVVAGLLVNANDADLQEVISVARSLSAETQYAICSSLTMLSLMDALPGMPDPAPFRQQVKLLLSTIEAPGG